MYNNDHYKTLIPMSIEEMYMRGLKNTRKSTNLKLFFVDGLGQSEIISDEQISALGLDLKWPEYIKHDLPIHYINNKREENYKKENNI